MAGSQNIARMSPRQRMINLMYIVLTAMLALNVSSDVLNGFNQVEDGLARTNVSITSRNADIYSRIAAFAEQNPEKGGAWYEKATKLRHTTDSLYNLMDALMVEIVKSADGADGDVDNIKSLDDLEAASYVMLSPTHGKGSILRKDIDRYRDYVTSLLTDSVKRVNIENTLSTLPQKENGTFVEKSWEENLFENMPVISAVTILRKLQSDVLYAEGEGMNALLNGIDAGDVRVNRVSAFVIPSSRNVMRGSKYTANIVLAAVDTTQRPTVVINGTTLDNQDGIYEVLTSKTGTFDYSGYIEMPRGDGSTERQDFTSSYTVVEPMATVSATMMNVLYAGIDNPISIAVPGVPSNSISATMTNGTLSRSGDHWVAKPSKVGSDAVVTVTAN
ncbi:MAG: gliding motility protein GldM, partial [Muribaculaceae bacterium]|nr:gliding motility protein GldM [Muribaculaceae bacterium]